MLNVSYIPDTHQIISCSEDKTIKLWCLEEEDTWKLIHTFEGHTDSIHTIIHIPDT